MQNIAKRIIVWAAAIALVLMIPLIAMQFTKEVNWSLFDFILMGVVLSSLAFAYELIARRVEKSVYRAAFSIGLMGAFFLFFVNGAVGIIGNEDQPANLMYTIVFAVGLIGSLMARFKPRGMAITLFTTAVAQMSVPLIALIIWPPSTTSWSPSVFRVFVLNACFAMLFVISALLFQRASTSK